MIARARRHRCPALVACAVAYGALSLALQRTLAESPGTRVYAQDVPGNDALLLVWTLGWGQHALWTDPLRVFDANIFFPHGRTLLYADHLLGLAALLAPLRLLTDNVVLVYNLATLAAPALNALALFALARHLTGSAGAAFVAGLAYGFAPIRFAVDRCHLGMLAAWWLPLVLLHARRTLARGRARDAALAGATLALQGLSGIYLTAFFLPVLAGAHLQWLRRFPARAHRRGWAMLLAAEGTAAVLLVPTAVAYRAVQRELGIERSAVVNALLSLQPAQLPGLVPVVALAVLVGAAVALGSRLPRRVRADRWFLGLALLGALVLALGPQATLPFGYGAVRAPYGMVVELPGLSALRAPGRMVHMALLCACVIAAGGLAALARGLGAGARRALVAVAALVVAAECWVAPPPTIAVPAARAATQVTGWLAAQPAGMRFVEFPAEAFLGGAVQQYATTAHFHRTLNGSMGLVPPVAPYVLHRLERFPAPDVVAELHALGLTHVVVYAGLLPPAQRAAIEAATGPGRPLALEFGTRALRQSRVYRLAGAAPPLATVPGRPLGRDGWEASASHAGAVAGWAVDGDPATAWTSVGELAATVDAWWDARPFPARWFAYAASGPVWLAVDLRQPVAVAAVVLRLGGSDPQIAPTLGLEVSDDGADWRAVPVVVQASPDVRALVADAAAARYALVPEAPVPCRHLRVVGPTGEWRIGDLEVRTAEEGTS